MEVCHSFVSRLFHRRDRANESIQVPVIGHTVHVVMGWLTGFLDILGEFLIEPFDPSVIAQLETASAVPYDYRIALVLTHRWTTSDVQNNVTVFWKRRIHTCSIIVGPLRFSL